MSQEHWDVIVIGSGPGGATVARELSQSGARVLVLEKGQDQRLAPQECMLPMRPMLKKARIHPIGGRASLVRGVCAGGSSMLYFATAWAPPMEMFANHGIHLERSLDRARSILPNTTLPDSHMGQAATRLKQAATDLGYHWKKIPKLINLQAIEEKGRYAAKWTAADFLDEAQQAGCKVILGARVLQLKHRNGRINSVVYRQGASQHIASAEKVVLAAGGLGSYHILQSSGFPNLSKGFFCDPLVAVFGHVPGLKITDEYAMAAGMYNYKRGYMMADMTLPPSLFAGFTAMTGRFHRLGRYRSTLSLMVKIGDQVGGRITASGGPRKRFHKEDLFRLESGVFLARQILEQAGAQDIYHSPLTSAHPGGTIRIGEHVDNQLETSVKNLYVCDCSVIPEAWGLPPTLTLVCLGIRLAAHLAGKPVEREASAVVP